MRRGILLLLVCMYGCAMQSGTSKRSDGVLKLSFANCSDTTIFSHIELNPPRGYKLSKVQDHQFCEFRLDYKDKSTFYIGTNIHTGSYLNAKNRLEKGINTYSINRGWYDTLRNNGVQSDEKFWLEWINGSYVVGYVNASDTMNFNQVLETIRTIENINSEQE